MLTNVTLVSVLHPHVSVFLSLSQTTGLLHIAQFHFLLYNGILFNPHKLVIRNPMVLFRGNVPFASHAFLGAVQFYVGVVPAAVTVLDAIVSTVHTARHNLHLPLIFFIFVFPVRPTWTTCFTIPRTKVLASFTRILFL